MDAQCDKKAEIVGRTSQVLSTSLTDDVRQFLTLSVHFCRVELTRDNTMRRSTCRDDVFKSRVRGKVLQECTSIFRDARIFLEHCKIGWRKQPCQKATRSAQPFLHSSGLWDRQAQADVTRVKRICSEKEVNTVQAYTSNSAWRRSPDGGTGL